MINTVIGSYHLLDSVLAVNPGIWRSEVLSVIKYLLMYFCKCLLTLINLLIFRAHSFSRKILPNSADQFAKFRGWPWQNCPNSAAYCGLPFGNKLSSILLRNQFLRVTSLLLLLMTFIWRKFEKKKCSKCTSVLSYATNIQK